MNTRTRWKSSVKGKVTSLDSRSQILRLVKDRDEFSQFCAEVSSELGIYDDYLESVEWGRLVTECWNELRQDIYR